MADAKKSRRVDLDSRESQVCPYEDISTKQSRITGEKFPSLALGVCDDCHWCYTLMNERGTIRDCPNCRRKVSQIPVSLDEICLTEENEKSGLTITFGRRLPLR